MSARQAMVEPLLPCQIRCILASQTQTLRQRVLRPDLASVPYRGDQLATTAHFGAFVDGTLVGVVSAFYEPLLIPIAPAGTLRAASFESATPPESKSDDPDAKSSDEPSDDAKVKLASKLVDESPCKATDEPEPTEDLRSNADVETYQESPTKTRQGAKADIVSDSKLEPASCAESRPNLEDVKPEPDSKSGFQESQADRTNSRRDASLERPNNNNHDNTNPSTPESEPKPEPEQNGQAKPEPGAVAFRLASASNSWRIRGLAVDLPVRGRGLGSRLIATCIDHARKQDGTCVWCVARCSAEPVYEKMGFHRAGDVFYLEGIGPVRYMIRALI